MACHVYDPIYSKVMTIVMFDMQIKDVEFQVFMWWALLRVMKTNDVDNLQFKGFIVNIVQAN
jgi:hypothetical protein